MDVVPQFRDLPPEEMLTLSTLSYLFMVALALGMAKVLGVSVLPQMYATPLVVSAGVLWAVPLLLMMFLTTGEAAGRIPAFMQIRKTMEDDILPSFQNLDLKGLVLLSLLAGISEELLFRAVIQTFFVKWGTWAIGVQLAQVLGVSVCAFLFGLSHAITPAYFVISGLAGAYLGVELLATGNLLAPMITHCVYDFITFWHLIRVWGSNSQEGRMRRIRSK